MFALGDAKMVTQEITLKNQVIILLCIFLLVHYKVIVGLIINMCMSFKEWELQKLVHKKDLCYLQLSKQQYSSRYLSKRFESLNFGIVSYSCIHYAA